METLAEVWADDLLSRSEEAHDLVGYLESVAQRPSIREDGHAHVIAIDSSYGQGKTFFLRRFDRHLQATEHVSAFVDAWVDDLEDEPIVALAATLDKALQPWVEKNTDVRDGLEKFKSKAGRVAKIVSIGLAKRGVGFLITQGAAEALGDEIGKSSEIDKDLRKDALKDAASGLVTDTATAVIKPSATGMNARIAKFREGQDAIHSMKESLRDVVKSLAESGMKLPITIIVDELDRCRPTYAIKVLEEIKHLFDVNGIAFVLGLHGRQLAHSVKAAYGASFDGDAYLRRFFSKRYSLKEAKLQPLVSELIQRLGINTNLLDHPAIMREGKGKAETFPAEESLTEYFKIYDLSARDVFYVMESLQTAMALVGNRGVQVAYLIPLLITQYFNSEEFLMPIREPKWNFAISSDPFQREFNEYGVKDGINALHNASSLDDRKLSDILNGSTDFGSRIVVDYGFKNGSDEYRLLQNYHKLVKTVRQFS